MWINGSGPKRRRFTFRKSAKVDCNASRNGHKDVTKKKPCEATAERSENNYKEAENNTTQVMRKKDTRDSGVAERNAKRRQRDAKWLQMGREAYSWFAAPMGLAAFYVPVPRGLFPSPPTAGPEHRRHRHITQWQVTLEMHSSPSSSASLKQAKTQNSHFLPAVGFITVFWGLLWLALFVPLMWWEMLNICTGRAAVPRSLALSLFIGHIHLVRSPQKAFGEGRQNSEGERTKLLSLWTNQIFSQPF